MKTYKIIDYKYSDNEIVPHGQDGFDFTLENSTDLIQLCSVPSTNPTFPVTIARLILYFDLEDSFLRLDNGDIQVLNLVNSNNVPVSGKFYMTNNLFIKTKKTFDKENPYGHVLKVVKDINKYNGKITYE